MLAKKLIVSSYLAEQLRDHKQNWLGCEACPLHVSRTHVVFARGRVPADILFIGEAPGESEDAVGLPFIGDAGDHLEELLDCTDEIRKLRCCVTNICCCIPREGNGDYTLRPPSPKEARACKPRLMEFIKLCQPQLIIALGRVPEKYCKEFIGTSRRWYSLPHPSWILRQGEHKQALENTRWISHLTRHIRDVF